LTVGFNPILATAHRREGNRIVVTSVVGNGTSGSFGVNFMVVGYNESGEIVEVRASDSSTVWSSSDICSR
jgi:hypothetical protein